MERLHTMKYCTTRVTSYIIINQPSRTVMARLPFLTKFGAKCYDIESNMWKNKCMPYCRAWACLTIILPGLWLGGMYAVFQISTFGELIQTCFRSHTRPQGMLPGGCGRHWSFDKILSESQGHNDKLVNKKSQSACSHTVVAVVTNRFTGKAHKGKKLKAESSTRQHIKCFLSKSSSVMTK